MNEDNVKQLFAAHIARLSIEWPFLTGWRFLTDRAKRRAGACYPASKTITLSIHHIQLNPATTIEDTLLHEIAHAICFETIGKHNHGAQWKHIAQRIGASAKATSQFNTASAKWVLVHLCPDSQQLTLVCERFRRNNRIRSYHLKNRPETLGQLFYVLKDRFELFMQGEIKQFELELIQ